MSVFKGSWYRNGVRLARTDLIVIRAEGDKHSLTAKNLTVDDAAEFSFNAEECQTSANIVVKGKLKFCI